VKKKIAWTGGKMKEFGVERIVGSHCTGINAVHGLRHAAGLERHTSVVDRVGSTFILGEGIQLGALNR
jgi:7,8-dihydropterin-6-yl-methyl-4-(beta-D-ribofuranosyl)aminobenzene 5'-phosphate synthase